MTLRGHRFRAGRGGRSRQNDNEQTTKKTSWDTHARTRVEFNPVSFLRFAELPAETTYVGDDDETETVETNTIARDLSGHTLDSLLSLTSQTLSFIYHYSRPSAKEQKNKIKSLPKRPRSRRPGRRVSCERPNSHKQSTPSTIRPIARATSSGHAGLFVCFFFFSSTSRRVAACQWDAGWTQRSRQSDERRGRWPATCVRLRGPFSPRRRPRPLASCLGHLVARSILLWSSDAVRLTPSPSSTAAVDSAQHQPRSSHPKSPSDTRERPCQHRPQGPCRRRRTSDTTLGQNTPPIETIQPIAGR